MSLNNIFNLQKSTTKLMYLTYCSMGGVIKSEFISLKIKFIWILCYLIPFIFVNICDFNFLIYDKEKEIFTVLYASLTAIASFTNIFIISVTLYFHRELENIINFLDQEDEMFEVGNKNFKLYDFIRIAKYHSFSGFLAVAYVSSRLSRVILTGGNSKVFQSHYSHFFYFPQMSQVNTWTMYIFYYFVEAVAMLSLFLPWFMLSIFITTLVFELLNKFNQLGQNMEAFNNFYFSSKDQIIYEPEKSNLDANIKKFISTHQQLVGSIKLFKTYVEIFFSAFLPFVLFIVTIQGFILIGHLKHFSSLDYSILIVDISLAVLKYCHMGNLLKDMNNIILEKIYEFRWDKMSPEQKKNILIFLGQAQVPINFHGIEVLPMLLSTFPKIMRLSFSMVQLSTKIRNY